MASTQIDKHDVEIRAEKVLFDWPGTVQGVRSPLCAGREGGQGGAVHEILGEGPGMDVQVSVRPVVPIDPCDDVATGSKLWLDERQEEWMLECPKGEIPSRDEKSGAREGLGQIH
ncbi:uncharacterized protein SCHCODRAFT_02667572 [Schizophyllum commune H4-8]|nr:uncharacterized protein SCHCODRAFT_02667572 [Schizophyllum commune H4-8]KAI5892027.1 hypothetical protein SCHCODRAFT_02667572 [Schizophyllum commune H4-8]